MTFTRYGIYFTPGDKRFADAGADWLGWDLRTAREIEPPYPELVSRPRKYGFHATLKPPFRLADGKSEADLIAATRDLANRLAPVSLGTLTLTKLGSFYAWTCAQPNMSLQNLAASVVRELDTFRAPATPEDIAKRLKTRMPGAQVQHVRDWGYPYVMDFFRFHMTLTGPTTKPKAPEVAELLENHFAGKLPKPLALDALTVVGERSDGNFVEIIRLPLSGAGN